MKSQRPFAGNEVGLLFLPVVLALLAWGCQSEVPQEAPSREPLRIGLYADPLSLDPHLNDEFLTFSVLNGLYEPLVAFDGELRLRPALAVSWENPTDLIWRFDLRAGVKFHDGRTLTAEDVVFSIQRAISHPESNLASYVVAVESVKAVGELVVEVVTRRPYPILLNKLTHVLVLPQGTPEQLTSPNGTGPYRLAEHSEGGLELVAFDAYWGTPVAEPRVEMVTIADHDERIQSLLEGRVDLILDLAPKDVGRVEATTGVHVTARDGLSVDYLQMRVDIPPFDDLRVRQAIQLALDREAWVEDGLLGMGAPAGQLVARSVFGYAPGLSMPERDVEAAKQLLADAGYPEGIDLVLESRASRQGGEVLRDQLAEAGFRVTLSASPWGELFSRLQAQEVQFYHGAALASTGDSSDILDSKFHSRTLGWGETNFNHYSNPELDVLIESSGVTLDMRQRRQTLEECMKIVMEDLSVVPLAATFQVYGVRDGVDFEPRADGRVFPHEISRSSRP
jgi:peptide/nickel transport system substrate-binding protein